MDGGYRYSQTSTHIKTKTERVSIKRVSQIIENKSMNTNHLKVTVNHIDLISYYDKSEMLITINLSFGPILQTVRI